ncbi:MAG: 30S ribosomal protein S20 [Chloroflexi bacterium]|nr:30S ribosomal protein S20 [Chloroflexota bacterium]
MATRSAAKAHRQSLKRRLRNRAVRSQTKTALKQAVVRIASGDLEAAREEVRAAISTLDTAVRKGVLHPNNAARRKSRLLLKYNAAIAAVQVPVEEPRPSKGKTSQARARRSSGDTPRRKPAKK